MGIGVILGLVSIFSKLAGIFGGKTGEKIEQGTDMLMDGLGEAGKAKLTPEQQVRIDEISTEAEVKLAEIGYKKEKLTYDDAAGGREVIKTALLSDDPIVRQARPKMMIRFGNYCLLFAFYAPLSVIVAKQAGVEIVEYMLMLKWIGAFLFSSFMTSFTGYTVARSADKKTLVNGDLSKIWSLLGKIGKKVS